MTTDQQTLIVASLKQFIAGIDRSLLFAGKLEVLIDDCFPEDQEFQDLVAALARYRPSGGDYLYDENHIVELCRRALRRLVA